MLDGNDETLPDSLFGHKGQIYTRWFSPVVDNISYKHPQIIGECRSINFGFDTMSLGIVPPGKLPIGDLWPIGSGAPILEEHRVGNEE